MKLTNLHHKTARLLLKNPLKNRWALSTVVTALIILVISVLLASVITYFAINTVSTRSQEESLNLTDSHVWINPSATAGEPDYSQAALMVVNTGGRDAVINKITVRGQDCQWTGAEQFIVYSTEPTPVSSDLYFQPSMEVNPQDGSAETFSLNPDQPGPQTYEFQYASGDMVLKSGYTLLIYIVNPDSINLNDLGLTVSITVFTAQSTYDREANVQAYAP